MAYFFNPLLRDLLQKKQDAATPSDIDRLQGEIDTINENITTINGNLKNKVPKFFASIDELEIGEIGEYQGETNGTFTHGNFYERGSGVLTPVFTEVDTVTLLRTKNLSGYSGLELPLYQTKLDGELPLLYSFDDDDHFYSLNIYPSAFGLPISYGSFVAFVCPPETGIISDCYLENFQFQNRIVTGYLTHFYYQGQEFLNKFENGNLYILYDGIWYPLLSIVQGGGSHLLNIYQCYMFQDNHLVEGVLLYDFSTTLALNTTATNHAAYAFYASVPPSFDLSFWNLISDTTSLFEFQLVLSPSVTCVGFATVAQGRYADTALQTITASGSGYISLTASAKSGDAGAKTLSISGELTVQPLATADNDHKGLAESSEVIAYINNLQSQITTMKSENKIFKSFHSAQITSVAAFQSVIPFTITVTSIVFDFKSNQSTDGYTLIGHIDANNEIEVWNKSTEYLVLSDKIISAPTSCQDMFLSYMGLTSLNLSNFDTSNVTNMQSMFRDCIELTSLDLSNFNTANVTNMIGMFRDCSALTTIIANNWSATVTSIMMFIRCTSLVGGNGTTFNSSHTDAAYAHIDVAGNPGYFTAPPQS